jgi:hypothetical protein
MSGLTQNQQFHLILADIAMAMAIQTLDTAYQQTTDATGYEPGSIRDGWLAQNTDKLLNRRVTALANAGLASLSGLAGPVLLEKAERFGVPLEPALADEIASHFTGKREAVMTYKR